MNNYFKRHKKADLYKILKNILKKVKWVTCTDPSPPCPVLSAAAAVTTTPTTVDCHAHATAVCGHGTHHITYCGNDGHVYHDV